MTIYFARKPGYTASFLLLLLVGLFSPGIAAAETKPIASTLSELVQSTGSTANTPTIEVAVTNATQLCYHGRYTAKEGIHSPFSSSSPKPLKPKSFHSASISKLFTATVIMQLRDEGKLQLSDELSTYLPIFKKHAIQLEHLLTHTSGLRDRKRAKARTSQKEVDSYIKNLAAQRTKRSPGSNWHYADANFNVLGRVIEQVTGEPYAAEMQKRLLEPLNMTNSSFEINDIPQQQRVTGHNKKGKPLKHPWDRAFLPSSGLQTNARDLARFAQAILQISKGQIDTVLISLNTLKEMTTVRLPTNWTGVNQGYGWQIEGKATEPVWRHAGGEAGYESLLVIYPAANLATAVLGNQKDWPRFQLAGQIQALISTPNNSSCTPSY